MDAGTRACVAYVAGCVISGAASHEVLDQARNVRIRMRGSIKGTAIEVFDYERNCKFMGTLPTLYDFGTDTAIVLEISGKNFSGRDKSAEQYFVGTVEGRKVKVHDYREARDFFYEI